MDKRIAKKLWQRLTGQSPKYYQGDAGIEWMAWSVPGMFDMQDIYALDAAVQRLPSEKPMVEIGSFCGRSTCFLTHLLKRHSKPNALFCSDKWVFEGADAAGLIPGTSVTFPSYREHVKGLFMSNLLFWHADRLPFAIEDVSQGFFEAWDQAAPRKDVFGRSCGLGGPISFALIDGNHTYAQTRADFKAVDKWLELKGLVFMHDTSESGFGCHKALKEILRSGRYRLVMENPNALIQKIKA